VFKKVIGKVCINPDCPQKDKVREESTVLCDCGQELQDQTITDNKKLTIFSGIMILILIGGGYLGVMKLKEKAKEAVTSEVTTAVTEGGKAISNAVGKTQSQTSGAPDSGTVQPIADPKAAMTLVSDGLNLVKKNKFQEAIDKFSQATSKDQNNDQAWGNLGAAYVAMGRHNDAIEPSRKATTLNPNNPIWHLNLAETYSVIGDKKNALKELEAAINNGFTDRDKLKNFNFKAIENEPKFKELVQKK